MLWCHMRSKPLSMNAIMLFIAVVVLITIGMTAVLSSTWLAGNTDKFRNSIRYFFAFVFASTLTSVFMGMKKRKILGELNAKFYSLLNVPWFFIGFFLRATYIRIYATLNHLSKGLRVFPQNWQETVFGIDLLYPPTLLPKAEQLSIEFSIRHLLHQSNENWIDQFIKFFWIFFIYFSATLYRWNIKASAWLWGPVAYALRAVAWADDETMRERMAWQTTWPLLGAMFGLLSWMLGLVPNALLDQISTWVINILKFTPGLNLRTGLLILFLCSGFCFLLCAYRLRSAHDKPLGDADNFKKYDDHLKSRFKGLAQAVRVSGQWTIACAVLTIWSFALAWALERWPQAMQYVVWDWLKPWL